MRKKTGIIYVLIMALVVLLNVIAWNSTAFCDAYIKYVFPIWVNTYGRLTGVFPFSVGEILLAAGVLCVVIFVLCILLCMMLGVYSLLTSQGNTPGKIRNGLWKFSKGYFCFFAWTVLIVCLIMTLNCSILYHASTFSEQYYGEEDGDYTLDDLIAVRNMVVERCNKMAQEMERDENGDLVYHGDMKAEAIRAMKALGKQYDQLDGYYPRPKPVVFSDFFSQQYCCGYYFPFSMEANYNNVMYIGNFPSTMCHELAHLRGYVYEDEANFISYLACIQSGDPFFEYCGYLSVLYYLDNDFYTAVGDDKYWEEIWIAPQVHKDNVFLKREEWDRIEEEAPLDTEVVEAVSDEFTDTMLKVNGVEDGMISYSRVVELILWYYSQE